MSLEQYQRTVNSLDKEIADLEKKKAVADKKAAENQKKAANVSISKNASAAMVKSKMRQIENYRAESTKASTESAALAKKIADKKKKRNTAAVHLQKEEQKERKAQDKSAKQIQQSYERKIEELQSHAFSAPTISENMGEVEVPEYDVFVSHAWEDKEDFVNEFVDALRACRLRVWYDTSEIKWGDSMRNRIDDGLKKSRFGVAVLSPNYIADGKYWTKAELDGLFQLESINGKVLLPIWHNLTKKDIMEYSPIIASKLAMSTATMTPQEIAEKLKELVDDGKPKEPEDETYAGGNA